MPFQEFCQTSIPRLEQLGLQNFAPERTSLFGACFLGHLRGPDLAHKDCEGYRAISERTELTDQNAHLGFFCTPPANTSATSGVARVGNYPQGFYLPEPAVNGRRCVPETTSHYCNWITTLVQASHRSATDRNPLHLSAEEVTKNNIKYCSPERQLNPVQRTLRRRLPTCARLVASAIRASGCAPQPVIRQHFWIVPLNHRSMQPCQRGEPARAGAHRESGVSGVR